MNTDGTDSTNVCWALVRFVRFVVNVVFRTQRRGGAEVFFV